MTGLGAGSARSDEIESADMPFAGTDVGSLQIAHYDILQKLAVGGMAEIFLASREGQLCVVKRLHAHLSRESVVGSRFIREANVASHLLHPNIARIYDFKAMPDGQKYLAMEYIAGQDVESMMFRLWEGRKMLPPELSITITLAVLEGLEYAHDQRGPDNRPLDIVHRDLSPRNVMVTYDGDTKIIDFGLARTNLGDFRTAPGMVLGTLRYMSPEQAVAEPVDRRSDLYSWAVVLYEMLSGRPLVTGANAQEVLNAVVTTMPPRLSTLNPTLPKALDHVLEKGLAKDRNDRWKTAKEFREALAKAAGPLGAVDGERLRLIGQFVRELFPIEHQKSVAIMESTRSGEVPHEQTAIGSMPNEVTRAVEERDLRTIVRARDEGPLDVATLVTSGDDSTRTAVRPEIQVQSLAGGLSRKLIALAFVAMAVVMTVVAAIAYSMGRAGRTTERVVVGVPQSQAIEAKPAARVVDRAAAETATMESPPISSPTEVRPIGTPIRPAKKRDDRKSEPIAAQVQIPAPAAKVPTTLDFSSAEAPLKLAEEEEAAGRNFDYPTQVEKLVFNAFERLAAPTPELTKCITMYKSNQRLNRLRKCFEFVKKESR